MDSLFSLDKKAAIVTGAARGNGRAIAEGLLAAGATVYFVDILAGELSAIEGAIRSDRARFIAGDVTDYALMEREMEKAYGAEKRIDILVNNAGVTLPGPSESYSDEKWERTYEVNLKAPFRLAQIAAGYMRRGGGGAIINITSISSEMGFPGNPAYVAVKGGLKQLTKALAKDWARYNIRVNNLGLGYFKTDMTKGSWGDGELRRQRTARTMLGRWGEPRDLVGPAVFLASEASRYMTAGDLYIDGGWLSNGL